MIAQTDGDVYRAHAAELTRYATALVGPDDAADVVTDAVLASFASPSWPHVREPRAYLFRAVFNHAVSLHRTSTRRRRRERLASERDALAASEREPSIDAQRALRTLSTQQRAVIYLTYWEDLTPGDIATLLGISDGSVRKQLARGREQLRKVMTR